MLSDHRNSNWSESSGELLLLADIGEFSYLLPHWLIIVSYKEGKHNLLCKNILNLRNSARVSKFCLPSYTPPVLQ